LYKKIKVHLSRAADNNSKSGHHQGSFDTSDGSCLFLFITFYPRLNVTFCLLGTDEFAKYCRVFLWVELGCFIGETEDLKNYGKLLPSEWYTVDTGFDANDPTMKRLFSKPVSKLKHQLGTDNASAPKRKYDYLLREESSSISSSSSKTSSKSRFTIGACEPPSMADIVRGKSAEIDCYRSPNARWCSDDA
jgi:hypothetical protein